MAAEEKLRKLRVAGESSAGERTLPVPAKPLPGQLGFAVLGVRDVPGRGGISPEQMAERAALKVVCRKCGANPGDRCLTDGGKPRKAHNERLQDVPGDA